MKEVVFHNLNINLSFFRVEKARIGYVFLLLIIFNSCALVSKTSLKTDQSNKSPFFDKVEVVITPSNKWSDNIENENIENLDKSYVQPFSVDFKSIEYITPLFFRYAVLLDVEVEKLTNQKLIEYIHQWWGVPYKYGGGSMNGIDCSNFVKGITQFTYGVSLPRTSRDQAAFCKTIDKSELREGDLVFFNTSVGISHVGLYLANDKFVHASSSLGVVISSLNETYWKKRFVKAGRLEKQG
jgi:lipoprotein Spr